MADMDVETAKAKATEAAAAAKDAALGAYAKANELGFFSHFNGEATASARESLARSALLLLSCAVARGTMRIAC